MTTDLLGVVRLVHRVTGVLVRLTPRQLTDLADGRLSLSIGGAPEPPADSVPPPLDRPAQAQSRRTSAGGPASVDTTGVDYAEIAATLREQDTVNDGLAYFNGLKIRGRKPLKVDLLAIAKQLNLTLPPSVKNADAITKMVNHAIGNRRKFEGLRP